MEKRWIRKSRELRDVYNYLRKKYRSDVVVAFLAKEYFLNPKSVFRQIRESDNQPVTDPSITYQTVFSPDFKL
jgi:hypothetical protein